jgi:hypothetical protein
MTVYLTGNLNDLNVHINGNFEISNSYLCLELPQIKFHCSHSDSSYNDLTEYARYQQWKYTITNCKSCTS